MIGEHYCPYCRRDIIADGHARDCAPGHSLLGGHHTASLLAEQAGRAIAESVLVGSQRVVRLWRRMIYGQ